MSNLFSYELDEEQIRSTLLDGGKQADLSDSAWDEFEADFLQNVTNNNPVKFKLPEFNLNINRNVVLPVIFIAGLVGVSAIMLSFIDFKTNTPPQVEKSLVPNPDNYKPEESKAAVLVKKAPQKPVEKPPVTETVSSVPVNTVVIPQVVTNNPPPVNNNSGSQSNPGTSNSTASRVAEVPSQPVANNNVVSDTATSSQNASRAINTNFNPQNNYQGQSRKKRRKLPPEQIETIKAPSILGAETTKKEEEPELEIKLD